MDSPSTVNGAVECGASASWLCGVISILAEAELLFVRYPWIGFVLVSMIGGFVGWCVLIERGRIRADDLLAPWQRLFLRLGMGGGVGLGSALVWQATDSESRGLPMLVSALIAVFPLEAYRGGLKRFRAMLQEAFK